jgi:hypothetical protein
VVATPVRPICGGCATGVRLPRLAA